MEKIWFISIDDKVEGPYSLYDLKVDPRITPDTLVWKEGFPKWLLLRDVSEAEELFKDDVTPTDDLNPSLDNPEVEVDATKLLNNELVLGYNEGLPHFPFWVFLIIFLIVYALYLIQN